MWLTGPGAPWHVGSSQTRARTRVPCISRQILNHCATREAQDLRFLPYKVTCTGAGDLTRTSLGAVIQLTTHANYIKQNLCTYDACFLHERITRDGRSAGSPLCSPLLGIHVPLPRVFINPSPHPFITLRCGKWPPEPDTMHVQRPTPWFPKTMSLIPSRSPHREVQAMAGTPGQDTGVPRPYAVPGRMHMCPHCPSSGGGPMAVARPIGHMPLCLSVPIRTKKL